MSGVKLTFDKELYYIHSELYIIVIVVKINQGELLTRGRAKGF